MKLPSWCLTVIFPALAGAAQSGLVGFGIDPYGPYCAWACLRSLSSLLLSCSNMNATDHGHMSHGASAVTTPACRAGDTSWLTTLAWCMRVRCSGSDVPSSKLEAVWEAQATGGEDPSVRPKWTYAEAVANVSASPPTTELAAAAEMLNETFLVAPSIYLAQWNALTAVQRESEVESAFCIAILVAGFGLPVVLTWLGHVPYVSPLLRKTKPYLVWPSLVGSYQVRPLPYLLGNAPTVGQALFVAGFFVLNLVLSAVGYETKQPHAWYPNRADELAAYIFYRTGVFAFVLAPLLILFAGRNNVLLWATDWSHSTFLLLHRWISRIFLLHVLVHSIIGAVLYRATTESVNYYIWGCVATVAVCILAVASGLYVRRPAYEAFLISHVVLSVVVLVGCWYHIYEWMGLNWGYEIWLYAACAVWFFDRLVRVARVLRNGVRRGRVLELGEGYLRVDVPGVRWGSDMAAPGRHAYVYFPTVNPLRPWENHPFSVVPTALLSSKSVLVSGNSSLDGDQHVAGVGSSTDRQEKGSAASREDVEKCKSTTTAAAAVSADQRTSFRPAVAAAAASSGISLFIKKSAGMTRSLRAHDGLLTLLDGPYSSRAIRREILRCDRLLLIGGGIGITSLLPWTACHANVRLFWSVRESARCLVDAVDAAVGGVPEREVKVGGPRANFGELLAREAEAGWHTIGVVVSGPGSLCDDVRAAVAAAGRRFAGRESGTVFELEVDAYTW